MVAGETLRKEDPAPEVGPEATAEKTPGQVIEPAVAAIEGEKKVSIWRERAKEFFCKEDWQKVGDAYKKGGLVVAGGAGLFALWLIKDVYVIFKFAKVFIEKRGRMTYADGKKIADDMFSYVDGGKKKA